MAVQITEQMKRKKTLDQMHVSENVLAIVKSWRPQKDLSREAKWDVFKSI